MQFTLPSQVGSGNMHHTEMYMHRREGAPLGMSGPLKSIAKHMIFGVGQKGEMCKNSWSDLNDLYIVRRAFVQGVACWGSR